MENVVTENIETVEGTVEEIKGFDINQVLENPEFKKIMESYGDKRVSSALTKKDAEYKTKLEEEQRKSKMTAEELQVQRETELAEREDKIAQYELKLSKIDLFKSKNYSLDLTDFVGGNSIEEIEANAEKITSVINALVEKGVSERLKGGYKVPKGTERVEGITKEDFSKMSYKERSKLATENPELYKELR